MGISLCAFFEDRGEIGRRESAKSAEILSEDGVEVLYLRCESQPVRTRGAASAEAEIRQGWAEMVAASSWFLLVSLA